MESKNRIKNRIKELCSLSHTPIHKSMDKFPTLVLLIFGHLSANPNFLIISPPLCTVRGTFVLCAHLHQRSRTKRRSQLTLKGRVKSRRRNGTRFLETDRFHRLTRENREKDRYARRNSRGKPGTVNELVNVTSAVKEVDERDSCPCFVPLATCYRPL